MPQDELPGARRLPSQGPPFLTCHLVLALSGTLRGRVPMSPDVRGLHLPALRGPAARRAPAPRRLPAQTQCRGRRKSQEGPGCCIGRDGARVGSCAGVNPFPAQPCRAAGRWSQRPPAPPPRGHPHPARLLLPRCPAPSTPAAAAGGCPWHLAAPHRPPCWLVAPRAALRHSPSPGSSPLGSCPRLPSLGEQLPASRLCRRNAGRERGCPGWRPTAGADKAAFLLPLLPAERAACSRRGKRRRQQMPRGRARLPPDSPRPPRPRTRGSAPASPRTKAPFLSWRRRTPHLGGTPGPADTAPRHRAPRSPPTLLPPAPAAARHDPSQAQHNPRHTPPARSERLEPRSARSRGTASRGTLARGRAAAPAQPATHPRCRRCPGCCTQGAGTWHPMARHGRSSPPAAGRAAGAGRAAALGGAQRRSPRPTWLPARSPSANALRARVPLPHPPSR